ncbi:unnamed protein product [Paramecium primaurelia]|uniref:Serine aminopeptidase S33 domain-containing protein n=1 Tax=Paramecium primaurelia TaxID=5886 RepID=A0A8S1NBN9_PARPR|nr:unnamed protein product [Paramecium primaurelia]
MEVNSFIFPAPKCEYTEKNFKELIWVPVYKSKQIKQLGVQSANQSKRPSTQQDFYFEESNYDQDVDENIIVHKSPPRLLNKYKSNNVKTLLSKKHQNRLYESLANVCLTSTPNEKIQHPRCNKLPIRHLKQITQQDEEECEIIKKIPCAYINNQSKQTLVYFHSNGEDLYQAYELMWRIGNSLKLNILGVEYPGYGIYKGDSNEQTILEDADHIMNYLINTKKIEESNIMICGRSIGSGPACYIASKYKPFMLILISPFLSIQQLVEHKLGKFVSVLIKERFPNYKHISEVQCPIYILHGQSDNMIPLSHALKLQRLCKCKCKLTTPYHMTHATFNLQQDLIIPLLRFMMN